MKTRTKNVRVTVTSRPITNISTGVIFSRGTYAALTLDEADIFKCICGKAIVEEVMPDGSLKKLDLFNYNKYNNNVNDNDEPDQIVQSNNGTNSEEASQTEQAHTLVNPNVAPVNQKELVNPSAINAGTAEEQDNDLVNSLNENDDSDAEHKPVDGEANKPNSQPNNSPKGYNKNHNNRH